MVDNKIDYSKLDISELELWFGRETAHLLVELSNFYYKDNIPYIQHHVNKNTISFNENNITTKIINNNDSYLKVFEVLTNIQNVNLNDAFIGHQIGMTRMNISTMVGLTCVRLVLVLRLTATTIGIRIRMSLPAFVSKVVTYLNMLVNSLFLSIMII